VARSGVELIHLKRERFRVEDDAVVRRPRPVRPGEEDAMRIREWEGERVLEPAEDRTRFRDERERGKALARAERHIAKLKVCQIALDDGHIVATAERVLGLG
jgi:hypothetical protein